MRKEAGNHDDISRTITHGLIGERTRADIHDGPEHNTRQSEAGYIDARPPPPIRRNLLATHGRTIHPGHKAISARQLEDAPALSAKTQLFGCHPMIAPTRHRTAPKAEPP